MFIIKFEMVCIVVKINRYNMRDSDVKMIDFEGKSLVQFKFIQIVGKNMQVYVYWMCLLLFVVVDYWCFGMKVLLFGERYQ